MQQLEAICTRLESEDSLAVIASIETGEPAEAGKRYANLVGHLYHQRHDVPRMLMIGQAGCSYLLRQADAAETAEQAAELHGTAKTIAYNASANAWPGWEDEGIEITRSDSVAAMDLARLNLRLARELERDDKVLGNAHWLVGAQYLALGDFAAARVQFETASERFIAAKTTDFEQMARGYVAIAEAAGEQAANPRLAAAIAALRALQTDDATFFADQLDSVARYFAADAK